MSNNIEHLSNRRRSSPDDFEDEGAEVIELKAGANQAAEAALERQELEKHDKFLHRSRNVLGSLATMGAVGTAYFGIAEQNFEQARNSFTLMLGMAVAAGSAEMLRQIHEDKKEE